MPSIPYSLSSTATLTATALFVMSSLAILGLTRARKSFTEREYVKTLDKMFRAVKTPSSRHTVIKPENANDNVFLARTNYFRRLAHESKLMSPDRRVKFIHVAGTKGKGSTCEYIASALERAGYRVGIFTSPHLHTARERIRIGRELISKEDLVRLGGRSLDDMSSHPWSVFFDLFLSTALMYFGERAVDYVILESGIGGRFDSTNFVDEPAACVITSISLDHQAILGDTIDKIAWQKAGIIKKSVAVFTPSNQEQAAIEVFRTEAKMVSAELREVPVGKDVLLSLNDVLSEGKTSYDVQRENACLSAAVLRHLDIPLEGMSDFFWPCRMETFGIIVDGSDPHNDGVLTVVLDGSHNGQSVKLFLQGLRTKYGKECAIYTVFGGGVEKCLDDMLMELLLFSDFIVPARSKHFKAAGEEEIIAKLRSIEEGLHASDRAPEKGLANILFSATSFAEAVSPTEKSTVETRLRWTMEYARSQRTQGKPSPVIAVCGSLFAAADAREAIFRTYPDLFSKNDWVRQCD